MPPTPFLGRYKVAIVEGAPHVEFLDDNITAECSWVSLPECMCRRVSAEVHLMTDSWGPMDTKEQADQVYAWLDAVFAQFCRTLKLEPYYPYGRTTNPWWTCDAACLAEAKRIEQKNLAAFPPKAKT